MELRNRFPKASLSDLDNGGTAEEREETTLSGVTWL